MTTRNDSRAGDGEPEKLYPIRTVSGLTGVNAVTLRAWERRYGLIRPQRTPKGHRLYTSGDIARIEQILTLLDQGISIGQVKPLLEPGPAASATAAAKDSGDTWQRYRTRLLEAVARFDEPALEAAYSDALSLYPVDLVIRNLAVPLLQYLGEHWREQPAGIAEEHFFSVYLRNRIGARIHHSNARGTGARLLLACLPGEHHELGLLLFALNATSHGYRVLLLGADLPLEQIPAVLARRHCDAVVLAGSARTADGLADNSLPALTATIDTPVFVGGGIARDHAAVLEKAGTIPVGEDFGAALQQMASRLRNPS